jgi:hypothetical protein
MAKPSIANFELLSSVRGKLNTLFRSASMFDYIPAAEHAAIIARTSTYDIAADWNEALSEMSSVTPEGLYFPDGQYSCDSTIHLKKQVHMVGTGCGLAGSGSTRIYFPADVDGLVVHRADTNAGGIEDPPTTGADGAIIEGLSFLGGGGVGAANGIRLRARAILINVECTGFSGDGFQVRANVSGDNATRGNANNFQVAYSSFKNNGKRGMFLDGPDSNAGVIIGSDASQNGEQGFFDSSFLGNTFVGCHTNLNTAEPYKTDNDNARSLFLGCYSEANQVPSDIVPQSFAVGGLHAAGFTASSQWLACDASGLGMRTLKVQEWCRAAQFELLGAEVGIWRLRFQTGTDYDLRFDLGNLDAAQVFRISGPDTTMGNGGGRPNPVLYGFNPLNLMIGPSNQRRMTNATAVPSSGEWGQGDIVWNSAPAAGGTLGWVCTTGGTAGSTAVFKIFGSIAA